MAALWSVTQYTYVALCISLIHSIHKQIIFVKTVYVPVICNLINKIKLKLTLDYGEVAG